MLEQSVARVLKLLYAAYPSGLGVEELRDSSSVPDGEYAKVLAYLGEKDYVQKDGSRVQITAAGIEYHDASNDVRPVDADTILDYLYSVYPDSVGLAGVRRSVEIDDQALTRAIRYLEGRGFIELIDVRTGVDKMFGTVKLTAAGIDYLRHLKRRRQAKARFV